MNTEFAKEWITAYNEQDIERQLALYADDFEFEDVMFPMKCRGKEELRALLREFHALPDEHSTEFVKFTGDSTGGAIEWTWTANLKSPKFLGVPSAGKTFHTSGISALTFENGKIVVHRDMWNAAAIFKDLGAL